MLKIVPLETLLYCMQLGALNADSESMFIFYVSTWFFCVVVVKEHFASVKLLLIQDMNLSLVKYVTAAFMEN